MVKEPGSNKAINPSHGLTCRLSLRLDKHAFVRFLQCNFVLMTIVYRLVLCNELL